MTGKPWLSAVIPSYNGNRWFSETLASVAQQGDPEIELIVVDGSDSDETLAIAEAFASKLTIRFYRRPDLSSWTAKTNFGVEQATADWICMLHKDDLWLPDRCRELRRWVVEAPQGVMHICPAYIIDETGRRLGVWRSPLPRLSAAVPSDVLCKRLLVQNFIAAPTPAIRRDAYLAVGGMDDQLWYTGDWDLYLKLAAEGDVYYHPEPLASFRIHGSSQTAVGSRGLSEFRSQMETVLDRYVGRLRAEQSTIRRLGAASIDVNVALAAANHGRPAELPKAVLRLLALGPHGIFRYLHHSRILERAIPRLRARIAGGL